MQDPGTVDNTIDVTPHPRLLSVLGDIEFAPWQCLAELIDNAFDDFLAHEPSDGTTPTVSITLPPKSADRRDAQVWVADNGRGMDLERLQGALSAGWTSNARYGKLGLFGMGFNVATARLGFVTTVRTTRAGDPSWLSVTLDLRQMEKDAHFKAPVRTEPKDDITDHGTQVIVSSLRQEQFDSLSRRQAKVRELLGDVYSYLLRERGFAIVVDGKDVQARRPCVWNHDRAVVVAGERYPAYIEIDKALTPQAACMECGRWNPSGTSECEECGSTALEERERRIWGWLGIQRYIDRTDFGIDFLRNGRKILIRDLQLFAWTDPNEPGARPVPEYPIEVPYEGRIVGEIHLDHVRVNYQKNAFEYDTIDWKTVVRHLRGDGPLRPKIAKEFGYETNTSPLGRLFTGYRRVDPGLARLIPGDGQTAIHQKARAWAELFRKGDADYQDDSKWYEAARIHDLPPSEPPPETTEGDDEDGDATGRLDIPDPVVDTESTGSDVVSPRETEDERMARYRAAGSTLVDISGEYSLPDFATADVTVYELNGTEIVDSLGQPVPVTARAQRGSKVDVFVDAGHALFTAFGGDPREYAVLAIAEFMRTRRGSEKNLAALTAALMSKNLPDQRVTPSALADTAYSVLQRVRETMLPVVRGNATGYWALLGPDDQAAAERAYAADGPTTPWDTAREEGDWILYAGATALSALVRQRPAEFLDGRVFRGQYSSFGDSHARTLATNRITGLIGDVGLLAERQGRPQPDDLNRGRLSCRLLTRELIDPPTDD